MYAGSQRGTVMLEGMDLQPIEGRGCREAGECVRGKGEARGVLGAHPNKRRVASHVPTNAMAHSPPVDVLST